MMRGLFLLVALIVALTSVQAFVRPMITSVRATSMSRNSLDNDTIQKLEDMRSKFDRLANVVSADADAEKSKIQDVVEKYSTYREIKGMMTRLRQMWRTEASETRRAKQLKSFVALYKGRIEVEDLLKEKMGMSVRKSMEEMKELSEIEKWDAEIAALETKLQKVKLVIPEGMSTRSERFGGAY